MTVILVASVVMNVILSYRVRSLTYARGVRTAEFRLKVGTAVPPIVARRLDGHAEVISYETATQPTVLYVFSPPCQWCARNVNNFNTIADEAGQKYRFIGLSLSAEGLAEYVAKNTPKLSVYSTLSPETLKAYKLSSTPQTIVVSQEGIVLQDWMGAYVGEQKSQIEAFFHVTLPGLRELPKAEAAKN